MQKPLIIFDGNNLCHVAHWTTGELEYNSQRTGAMFGFFRTVVWFAQLLKSNRFVFCWDTPTSKNIRRSVFGGYKIQRGSKSSLAEEDFQKLNEQMEELRNVALPQMGFKNVFGYADREADDVIADLVNQYHDKEDRIVVVSSDTDLYQLIKENVTIWPASYKTNKNPMNLRNFWDKYGIDPGRYVLAKALAGDSSDDIDGLPRIGEQTAVKYIRGLLRENTKAYQTITNPGNRLLIRRNKILISIPFVGLPPVDLSLGFPVIEEKAVISVFDQYGFNSFMKSEQFMRWTDNVCG